MDERIPTRNFFKEHTQLCVAGGFSHGDLERESLEHDMRTTHAREPYASHYTMLLAALPRIKRWDVEKK